VAISDALPLNLSQLKIFVQGASTLRTCASDGRPILALAAARFPYYHQTGLSCQNLW